MERTAGLQTAVCSVCGRSFEPRFSYQLQERDGRSLALCSARCQLRSMTEGPPATCAACGRQFAVEYAFQTAVLDGKATSFCSMACREAGPRNERSVRRIAVYNLKGGTGKTTTSVSLATALAGMGLKVLLVDADPQGSVAVCLGVKARRGLYQILVLGAKPEACTVTARPGLDVITAARSLADAEIYLGSKPHRHRVMRDRLADLEGYDVVLVDCSPSVGLLSMNALRAVDSVIVPVSCEYLGVKGAEQALAALSELEEKTGHGVRILGVLPTFLDRRLNVCEESLTAMRERYGDLLLRPIRTSSKLKEAPAQAASIHEHAPGSRGARDYVRLARWLGREHLGWRPASEEEPDRDAEADDAAEEGR